MIEKYRFSGNLDRSIAKNSFKWKSPSNIALVKYWGKKADQIPLNPSISFTLSHCFTETNVIFIPKETGGKRESLEVYLDGSREKGFEPKILQFLERIITYSPYLEMFDMKVNTSNSFPHSSGIASSASGLSAMALCVMSLEKEFDLKITDTYFYEKASFLARLGSGSAARSVQGPLMVWGASEFYKGSNDLFAISYHEIADVYKDFQDTILLIDKGQKQVSSTVGHGLMNDNPFAEARFEQARGNMKLIKDTLTSGNLEEFGKLVEKEALTLHALMMASDPYFILMKPNTLKVINLIWEFRKKTNTPVFFTLDAGANVHVLYPNFVKDLVISFIQSELVAFCENEQYICDNVGFGAVQESLSL